VQEYAFENYNKMEDIIMFLGKNACLKMNINLFHKSERIGRISYHSEVRYFNEKIGSSVINLKRSFDFFMSIENLKPINGEKQYIMIRQEDIYLLRKVLLQVYDYFNNSFDKIFVKHGNRVSVAPEFAKPVEYNGLPLGKYLIFTPDIIDSMDGTKHGCIRMNLSSPTSFVYMSLNKLSGLVETINNADMYLYAQNMSTYFGKPENGTNLFDMSAKQDAGSRIEATPGRMLKKKDDGKNISYFQSKMNKLEG